MVDAEYPDRVAFTLLSVIVRAAVRVVITTGPVGASRLMFCCTQLDEFTEKYQDKWRGESNDNSMPLPTLEVRADHHRPAERHMVIPLQTDAGTVGEIPKSRRSRQADGYSKRFRSDKGYHARHNRGCTRPGSQVGRIDRKIGRLKFIVENVLQDGQEAKSVLLYYVSEVWQRSVTIRVQLYGTDLTMCTDLCINVL